MELYSRILGKGSPFVILHGLYGSSDNWYTHAKELSKNFQVHLIDQRNHGKSPHSNIHNYSSLVNDLYNYFVNNKIDKAILLGHSMGGKVAMQFTLNYPLMIDSLIVVDISPFAFNNADKIMLNFHKLIFESLLECDSKKIDSRIMAENVLKRKLKDKRLVMFLLKNLKRDYKNNKFYWQLNIKSLYSSLNKIVEGIDLENSPSKIKTLIIKASNSLYISKNDAERIKEIFVNSTFCEIKNAGHWVHAEQFDEFMRAVKMFVL